ncbi:MAG: hypothetical protein ACI9GW_000897 [Halieaceae bacterium]|jgi:hypothetical protein
MLDDEAPRASGGDADIKITAAIHGGKGSIRQGILRKLVVRFDLAQGLHIYGEPVPPGMVATEVTVSGPPGFTVLAPVLPPTESLHLENMVVDLQVWSGAVDIVVPFYAKGELASEARPLDSDDIDIQLTERYQACTENECLLPKTETYTLTLPMDVIDVPALALHQGHGQREGSYSSVPALKRLLWRKFKAHPLGLPRYIWKTLRLEIQAWRRRRAGS